MVLQTSFLIPYALLALRIITGIVFFSSGTKDLQKPVERGKSTGLSLGGIKFLGVMEILSGISVAFGVFAQFGALAIMVVMLGAMYKKMFEWKIGFYDEKDIGWHYDLTWFISAFVILATGGGAFTII